jgi:hypothetical protein
MTTVVPLSTVRSSAPPPPTGPRLDAPDSFGSPTLRQQLGRAARLLLSAIAVGIAYLIDGEVFAPVILLFLIVVPFEKMYPRRKGQKLRRPLVGTDITFALISPLLNVFGVAAAIVIGGLSLFWLPGMLMRPLVAMLPSIAMPIVAFFLFDFLGYWTHRWAHEVPFLWRFHAVHHSPEHMDWIWHHANESDAIGHNYAPALPVWDQVFGTFFMPKGDCCRHASRRRAGDHLSTRRSAGCRPGGVRRFADRARCRRSRSHLRDGDHTDGPGRSSNGSRPFPPGR